jgi:hypothetical protein
MDGNGSLDLQQMKQLRASSAQQEFDFDEKLYGEFDTTNLNRLLESEGFEFITGNSVSDAAPASPLKFYSLRALMGLTLNPPNEQTPDQPLDNTDDTRKAATNTGFRTWYASIPSDHLIKGEVRAGEADTKLYEYFGIGGRAVYLGKANILFDRVGRKIVQARDYRFPLLLNLDKGIIIGNQYVCFFPGTGDYDDMNKYSPNVIYDPIVKTIIDRCSIDLHEAPRVATSALRCAAEERIFSRYLTGDSFIKNGRKAYIAISFAARVHYTTIWMHACVLYGRGADNSLIDVPYIDNGLMVKPNQLINYREDDQLSLADHLTKLPRVPEEGSVLRYIVKTARTRTMDMYTAINDRIERGSNKISLRSVLDHVPEGKWYNPAFTKGCGHLVMTYYKQELYLLLVKRRHDVETCDPVRTLAPGYTVPFGRAIYKDSNGLMRVANPILQSFYELEEEVFQLVDGSVGLENRLVPGDDVESKARHRFLMQVMKHVFAIVHDPDNMFLLSFVPMNIFKAATTVKGSLVIEKGDVCLQDYIPYGSVEHQDSETVACRLYKMNLLGVHMIDDPKKFDRFMFSVFTILASLFVKANNPNVQVQVGIQKKGKTTKVSAKAFGPTIIQNKVINRKTYKKKVRTKAPVKQSGSQKPSKKPKRKKGKEKVSAKPQFTYVPVIQSKTVSSENQSVTVGAEGPSSNGVSTTTPNLNEIIQGMVSSELASLEKTLGS